MYNVGIIGLGHIASTYSKLEDTRPYSHTGGIRFSEKVRLAAACDLKEEMRRDFRDRWQDALGNYNMYTSDVEMLEKQKDLDIIAVCVRGPEHFDVAMRVIEYGPRAMFLEKPPSCSLDEMDKLYAAAKAKGIIIMVSYTRHWSPANIHMAKLIKEGLLGDITHVITYSAHAVLSFGIHSTDLMCQFAGYCPKSVVAYGTIPPLPTDPSLPKGKELLAGEYHMEPQMNCALVEFENGVFGTQIRDPAEYGGHSAEIIGTNGWAKVGIYTPPKIKLKDGSTPDPKDLGFPEAKSPFTVAYDQLADYFDGGEFPHCTDENFRIVNELGFAMVESIYTGKKVVLPASDRSFKVYANG